MEFDLLRYSETRLDVCTQGWARRQLHDLVRQVLNYPARIRICPCLEDPWVRETLCFLGAVFNNESSCQHERGGGLPPASS